jgi:hypothetical protein
MKCRRRVGIRFTGNDRTPPHRTAADAEAHRKQ